MKYKDAGQEKWRKRINQSEGGKMFVKDFLYDLYFS